jgi:hypothetical protein
MGHDRLSEMPHSRKTMGGPFRALLAQAIAAAEVEGRPIGARVHELRTSLKKAQALLKLVGPPSGRPARRERRRLAAVARRIGPVRDPRAREGVDQGATRAGRRRRSGISESSSRHEGGLAKGHARGLSCLAEGRQEPRVPRAPRCRRRGPEGDPKPRRASGRAGGRPGGDPRSGAPRGRRCGLSPPAYARRAPANRCGPRSARAIACCASR